MSIFDLQNSATPIIANAPAPATPSIRNPFPQINTIRSFVVNELIRRKTTYPLPTNTPFVRFTSCKADTTQHYQFFSLGLTGFGEELTSLFDLTYGSDKGDVVGYAYDTTTNTKTIISSDQLTLDTSPLPIFDNSATSQVIQQAVQRIQAQQHKLIAKGTNPNPGIISATVTRGANPWSPTIATVKFLCYNRAQLEFLRNHFMIVGSYVVLEWGNQFANKQLTKILDFTNPNIIDTLVQTQLQGRNYVIDNYIAPNDANYDLIVGKTGNFVIGYDARQNLFECTIRIVTSGETPWGIQSAQSNLQIASTSDSQYVSSIHAYFKPKGTFDIKMGELAAADSNGIKICSYHGKYSNRTTNVNNDIRDISSNANDYLFISWNSFINDIIPHLFRMVTPQSAKQELQQFMGMDTPQIGSNQFLISCNPDTLILITKQMKAAPPAFTTIGNFDDDDIRGTTGNLNKGVWLNTNVIRNSFQGTNSFMDGMNALLNQVNDAVAGYWNLHMYYDEENGGKYRIVDGKGITKFDANGVSTIPQLYMFNHANQGELIDFNMDSNFPPELITLMMIYPQVKNNSLEGQQLINSLPFAGEAAAFTFALNWTNLIDIVDQAMTAKLNANAIAQDAAGLTTVTESPSGQSVSSPPVPNTANMSIAGADFTSTVLSKLGTSAAPDATLGSLPTNNTSPAQPSNTAFTNNNSPIPISSTLPPNPLTAPSSVLTKNTPITNIPGFDFNAYKKGIQSIESAGAANPYAAQNSGTTGALGAYQFTSTALEGLGFLTTAASSKGGPSGRDIINNPDNWNGPAAKANNIHSAQDFMNNPTVQDTALQTYTQGNFSKLFGTSVIPPVLKPDSNGNEIAGYLNVAHGYGPGGASSLQQGNTQFPTTNGSDMSASARMLTGIEANQSGNPFAAQNAQHTLQSIESQTPTGIAANANAAVGAQYQSKFGYDILGVVNPDRAAIINQVAKDGYARYPIENSFVSPVPTMTSVELKMLGTAGISITDSFFVDKLPFIFEQYGCFRTVGVSENISTLGWYTTVKGFYAMLWADGKGPPSAPITQSIST